MNSPAQTVNDLMQYLRDRYCLNAPVLPFYGMSAALARLWNMLVRWFPSRLPPVAKIPVVGDWQVPLPTGRSLAVADIYIVVELADALPPAD
jgi:hypothetical protein